MATFSFWNFCFTVIGQNPGDYLFHSSSIHTINIFFTQPGWYDSLIAYKPLEKKMKGDVSINGYTITNVGIQFKGNSSFNHPYQKKSWKIDFNAFVSNQKFDGLKAINLNNGFKDPTFLREKIALDFCSKHHIPAPRCTYANVYVNGTHWGFYLLVEQVNTTFIDNWFVENNGNLFKGDPQGTLQWFGSNPATYYSKYELKTNEAANDWTYLVKLINIINNKPPNEFYDSLESVLTTSLYIKSWAFNILFANLDSYQGSGHNYYIYHDLFYNKFGWITWDVNEAFGNFNMGMSVSQLESLNIFYIPNPTANRPLTNKMLQNTTYKQRYIDQLCQFMSDGFDTVWIFNKIDSLSNLIRPHVYADSKKFYTDYDFENNLHSNVTLTLSGGSGFVVPGLKSFTRNRWQNVKNQLFNNNCYVSVNEYLFKNKFLIYPNPSVKEFYVSVPDGIRHTDFHLYDILGKEVNIQLNKINDKTYCIIPSEKSGGIFMLFYGKRYVDKILLHE